MTNVNEFDDFMTLSLNTEVERGWTAAPFHEWMDSVDIEVAKLCEKKGLNVISFYNVVFGEDATSADINGALHRRYIEDISPKKTAIQLYDRHYDD